MRRSHIVSTQCARCLHGTIIKKRTPLLIVVGLAQRLKRQIGRPQMWLRYGRH